MAKATTVKQAIRTVLYGDSLLMGLLGNPTAHPRRISYWMPPDEPEFPFIVYWIDGEAVHDLGSDLLSSTASLNFNCWAKDNAYEDVAERVIALLHHSTAIGQRVVLMRQPQELYDQDMDAYAKNIVFNLYHRRAVA